LLSFIGEESQDLRTVRRPDKCRQRVVSNRVFGDLEIGGAQKVADDRVDIETVVGFLRRVFENVGDLGAVGIGGGVSHLIKSQGGDGGNDREESSVGRGD